MGGRAVEGTGLENRQARKGLVGSNPTPSATNAELLIKSMTAVWTSTASSSFSSTSAAEATAQSLVRVAAILALLMIKGETS